MYNKLHKQNAGNIDTYTKANIILLIRDKLYFARFIICDGSYNEILYIVQTARYITLYHTY